jgi:hypothetical protein
MEKKDRQKKGGNISLGGNAEPLAGNTNPGRESNILQNTANAPIPKRKPPRRD